MRDWREIVSDTNDNVWDKLAPIEGRYAKLEQGMGAKANSNLYTIQTDNGPFKVWGSTVLDDKLTSVPMGSYVKIEYMGKETSKTGTQYHTYRVFVDTDAGASESDDVLNKVFPGSEEL